ERHLLRRAIGVEVAGRDLVTVGGREDERAVFIHDLCARRRFGRTTVHVSQINGDAATSRLWAAGAGVAQVVGGQAQRVAAVVGQSRWRRVGQAIQGSIEIC